MSSDIACVTVLALWTWLLSVNLEQNSIQELNNNVYHRLSHNRPFSLGGHVESQEDKKLCFCTASLALNSHVGEASRAKTKLFIHLRLNMAAE